MKTTLMASVMVVLLLTLGGAIMYLQTPAVDTNLPGNGNTTAPGNGTSVTFQTLKAGSYNALTQKQQLVIQNASAWSDLWTAMFPTEMIASAIDFDKSQVIAVFAGQKSSGGHGITITKITQHLDRVEVFVMETAPGSGCITTQALTQPYHIVEMKRTNKPIQFTVTQSTTDC